MKVKEMIAKLQKQDPEKELYIQQGIEFDYAKVYSVRAKEIINGEETDEDGEYITEKVVVIDYE